MWNPTCSDRYSTNKSRINPGSFRLIKIYCLQYVCIFYYYSFCKKGRLRFVAGPQALLSCAELQCHYGASCVEVNGQVHCECPSPDCDQTNKTKVSRPALTSFDFEKHNYIWSLSPLLKRYNSVCVRTGLRHGRCDLRWPLPAEDYRLSTG